MEVLLIGAVIMIAAVLIAAWLMTFAKWFPIPGVDVFLTDYNAMIRAHIDFVLMALFCLAFYAIKIPLPVEACWLVVIGGITNPTIFIIAAFDPDFWSKMIWKVYAAFSFIIATTGFVWIGITILDYAV